MMDDPRREDLRAFVARLQLPMGNLDLVDRALTHASIVPEETHASGDYESLEFLGDAALGLAIADELFRLMPDQSPGEYSRMRAGIVNRRRLAKVAHELDIAPVIRLGRGEEQAGGRRREALLADCMEALIGAIYVGEGWDAARAFVMLAFRQEIERALTDELVWDYKSRLQHYCQAERIELPHFSVVRSEGPDHKKRFEVEVVLRGEPAGCGAGFSKKEAEQNAARAALEREGLLPKRVVNEAR